MKLVSRSAYALMLAAAFFAVKINRASALPMHSVATATHELFIPVACKYGSGKCANVKPEHAAPSTKKLGPEDPTVDPDCAHYGNCRGGNPEGGSASAKGGPTKGGPTKGFVKMDGIDGESKDHDHKDWIRAAPGGIPPKPTISAASPTNSLKLKK
jgi:hypothetical protein